MTKKSKAGGEIDSYCTKCKLDLAHRIIAMVGDTVKKVECKTCGSHHLYRKPKTAAEKAQKAEKAEKALKADKGEPKVAKKRAVSGAAARSANSRAERANAVERENTAMWEKAIAGQPAASFRAYRTTLSFEASQLIRHSKFGDGVVLRVMDRNKVEVLFKDGPKTMAHGQEG